MKALYNEKQQLVFIPKQGLAPMLFLKFLRDYKLASFIKDQLNILKDHPNKPEYFCIKIYNKYKYELQELVNYINNNS